MADNRALTQNKFDLSKFIKKLFGYDSQPQVVQTQVPPFPKLEMIINEEIVISPDCLQKFNSVLKLTLDYKKKIMANPECCICLEEKETIPLKCLHTLCKSCYDDMLMHSYTFSENCPICQERLKLFDPIPSNYILITHLGNFDLGLIITPKIYNNQKKLYINSLVVRNVMVSTYPGSQFEHFMHYIMQRHYMLIFVDDIAMEIMASVINLDNFNTTILSRLCNDNKKID